MSRLLRLWIGATAAVLVVVAGGCWIASSCRAANEENTLSALAAEIEAAPTTEVTAKARGRRLNGVLAVADRTGRDPHGVLAALRKLAAEFRDGLGEQLAREQTFIDKKLRYADMAS